MFILQTQNLQQNLNLTKQHKFLPKPPKIQIFNKVDAMNSFKYPLPLPYKMANKINPSSSVDLFQENKRMIWIKDFVLCTFLFDIGEIEIDADAGSCHTHPFDVTQGWVPSSYKVHTVNCVRVIVYFRL